MDRSTQTFFIQRGSGCRFSGAFPIFGMLIRSGDIRDQSRKLSEIMQNFRSVTFSRRRLVAGHLVAALNSRRDV